LRRSVSGLGAWLVQRVTAVYMLLFLVFLLAHLLSGRPSSYPAWRAWIASPAIGVATFVFWAALSAHAWVGLRDVALDYIQPIAVRVGALALLAIGLVGLDAWVVRILWRAGG